MVRPLTLVSSYGLLWATTLTYLASQPCIGLKRSVGLNSPCFVLPPQFQPPICNGLWLSPFWPPAPVSASSQLQVSLVRLSMCPLVFYPQFGLHSAMGLPPSFWSPVFILAFPLQQSSTLVLVSHSAVGPGQPLLCGQTPCLIWPLLLSRPSHALSSLLLCHGPSTVSSASDVVLGLSSLFSLPCSVWFPLCVQPPMLCLASSLLWASCSWSGLFLPGGPALSIWPLLPSGPPPACPHSSFSSRGRLLCCGLSAAPLWVWRGCAVPASPRASATH